MIIIQRPKAKKRLRQDFTIDRPQANFRSLVGILQNSIEAVNESLWEPGAELRACDDAWRHYSAHLEVKDIPVKIRTCEVEHGNY